MDGRELNFIRRKIEYLMSEMEASGCQKELYNRELPLLMDEKYTRRAEEIRKTARAALEQYQANEDYLYLRENLINLRDGRYYQVRRQIEEEISFVERLERAVEKDYIPEMRRYVNVDENLNKLSICRERLTWNIEYMSPFSK